MSLFHLLHRRRGLAPWAQALLALSLVVAAPAWPASPVSFAFDDALRLAVVRAPLLRARRLQSDAAREDAARAAALPDPRLTLGLANVPVTGGDAFDLRADDMTMQQIGLVQDVPARAKRRVRQAVADRLVEQAEATAESDRIAVRRGAAQAWIALWAALREEAALQAQREQSTLAVRIAKARLAGGTATATEVMAVQADGLALDNRLDAARAAVDAARATLGRWLGIDADALTTAGAPPDLSTLPVDEATLLHALDRQGPLLPWAARESVADAAVEASIASKRPDWSIGATYGLRERTPTGMARSDMVMLQVSIDLPLFTRNRQDRDVAARRAELLAVAAERDDARRVQLESVRRALAEWKGMQRQVARKESELLPLARDRAQAALAAYRGGGPLQPWLDARRDELALHVEHARHLAGLGRAWAELAYLLPTGEASP